MSTESISSITAATQPNDWSIKILASLLGPDFVASPLSVLGGPTTLLGQLFLVFNTCVFAIGSAWAVYKVVGGIAATANEGEVLGRNMSTIWFPIRMVVGITGMIPVFGGFTLNQAIALFWTVVGVGVANTMLVSVVTSLTHGQSLLSSQPFTPAQVQSVEAAAHQLFASNVCLLLAQSEALNAPGGATYPADELVQFTTVVDHKRGTETFSFGSLNRPNACGFVTSTVTARKSTDAFGFRTNAVDYTAIAQSSNSAYRTGLLQLNSESGTLAKKWVEARAQALAAGGSFPEYPATHITAAVSGFQRSTQAVIGRSIEPGSLTKAAETNIQAFGWIGLGAWYSTIAEVNNSIADASRGPSLTSRGPEADAPLPGAVLDALRAVEKAFQRSKDAQGRSGGGDTSRALVDTATQDSCVGGGSNGSLIGTATGNCSLGQGIVSAAIRGTSIGSGGGGNATPMTMDSAGWVDPVIMFKNIGDYCMSIGSTLLAGGGIASFALAKVGVDSAVATFATSAGLVLLLIGAALSIFLPMVPFINWIGAVLAYFASVVEAFAGATLHSMAHVGGEGEGLGQGTHHGYLSWVNLLVRPALMIIGFFLAAGLLRAVGTLQAYLFLPAMASAQGNSVTGLASICAFLLLFGVMNLTLISGAFQLIFVLTDHALAFIGQSFASHLGRDTADHTKLGFQSGLTPKGLGVRLPVKSPVSPEGGGQ